jgi:hypothetical protein
VAWGHTAAPVRQRTSRSLTHNCSAPCAANVRACVMHVPHPSLHSCVWHRLQWSGPVTGPIGASELALGHTAGDSRRCAADHRRRFAPPAIRRLGRALRLGPCLDQDSQDLLSPRPFAVDHSLAPTDAPGCPTWLGGEARHLPTRSMAAQYGGSTVPMGAQARLVGPYLPLGRF